MSAPTPIERLHYAKLVGRQITAILWEELHGRTLPVLLLNGRDRDGYAATATILADPEGNGSEHLDHNLRAHPCRPKCSIAELTGRLAGQFGQRIRRLRTGLFLGIGATGRSWASSEHDNLG